jgi:hypothetical protein
MAALLVVATALAGTDEDRASRLQVVGPPSTITSTVVTTTPPPMTTTVVAPFETTTTRGPGTVPPTTAVPPTTEAPAAPTTTRAVATTTTTPPTMGACDPGDIRVTATTDRASYVLGATVTVTAEAVNRGSRPCQPADPSIEFFNPAGRSAGGIVTADRFTMPSPGDPSPTWEPGEVLSHTFQWPAECRSDACSFGQYTAVVTFGGAFRSAPASFTVTAP